LDYAATGGPNEIGGRDFKWGARHHYPTAGDGPAFTPLLSFILFFHSSWGEPFTKLRSTALK